MEQRADEKARITEKKREAEDYLNSGQIYHNLESIIHLFKEGGDPNRAREVAKVGRMYYEHYGLGTYELKTERFFGFRKIRSTRNVEEVKPIIEGVFRDEGFGHRRDARDIYYTYLKLLIEEGKIEWARTMAQNIREVTGEENYIIRDALSETRQSILEREKSLLNGAKKEDSNSDYQNEVDSLSLKGLLNYHDLTMEDTPKSLSFHLCKLARDASKGSLNLEDLSFHIEGVRGKIRNRRDFSLEEEWRLLDYLNFSLILITKIVDRCNRGEVYGL